MRILSQLPLPQLAERLAAIDPALQLQILGEGEDLPDVEFDALLTSNVNVADLPTIVARYPTLRWVHVLGTGVDQIPLGLLTHLQVTCSRGASAVPIAEWVMAMLLADAKGLPDSWVDEPPAQWHRANLGTLEGQTLGLVGFGAIAQAVARRALAFDMRVLATVRRPRSSPMAGVDFVESLDQLLPQVDHLVLALPATAQSQQLLNAERLHRLKPGMHLINVARAELVDQEALRLELDSGRIRRASLDVVYPEPLPAGHWLYHHRQVKLSPHLSWNSPDVLERLLQTFFANAQALPKGEPLDGLVDCQAGY